MTDPSDDDDRTVLSRPAGDPPPAAPDRSPDDDQHLPVGTRLGEFEIRGLVGEGGFSVVYEAWDHQLERTVALKEYMPASLATRRRDLTVQPRSSRHQDTFEAGLASFVNEGRLLARFDHPALVKVHRFWQANGTAYMAMPLVNGTTLKDTVRAMSAPPGEAWLLALLDPLTAALAVLHRQQCYHRDIAPDNVLLLAGSGQPLLLDFGAARRVVGDMTHALTVILKPGYAPVEQYGEETSLRQGPWTDVYALAAVVHWIVTGKTPPISVGRMVDDGYVPLATRLAGRYSPRFLSAIDRALEVLPAKRTASVEAFRVALGIDASGGQEPAGADEDPERTVIRVPGRSGETGPRTSVPPSPTTLPGSMAVTAPATSPKTTGTGSPTPPSTVDRPVESRSAGRGPWVAAVAGGAALCIGIGYWALRSPTADAPGTALPGASAARSTAVAPAGSTSPAGSTPSSGSVPTVAATPPITATPPTAATPMPSSAATVTTDPAVPAVSTATPPSTDAAPRAPAGTPPAARSTEPAVAATHPTAASAAGRIASAPRPPRNVAQSPYDTRPPRAATAADPNAAECARLMQRVSLGDASPATIEQMKNLRCR